MKRVSAMWRSGGTGALHGVWRLLRADLSGVSAVEFALIAPVLLVMVLGMADLGRYYFSKMEVMGAVRAGAQYVILHGYDGSASATTAVTSVIQNATSAGSGIAVDGVSQVCICSDGANPSPNTCAGTCNAGETLWEYAQISASYSFTPMFWPDWIMGSFPGGDLGKSIMVRVN